MSKKKILAVDDEPNILLSIEFILEQEGYDVHTACDGEEAMEMAEKVEPDLVLLDIAMPKKDGYEVCTLLRKHEKLASVKVIMLTAKGQSLDKKKGLDVGADAYLTKPFGADELLQTIESALNK
jgi:DNA-binding response OmpR family regulator